MVLGQHYIFLVALLAQILSTGAFLASQPKSSARSCNQPSHFLPTFSTLLAAGGESGDVGKDDDGESFHPVDDAETTVQLLRGIWEQISAGVSMEKGEQATVLYPGMATQMNDPEFFTVLLGHLDACKDVCDYYGITTVLIPYKENGKIVGFTVKSYNNKNKQLESFEFDYDPFWDDGTDFEELYGGIDDELEAEAKKKLNLPEIEVKIPDDDEEIIDITKVWVSKMMSDMGICPFTQGAEMAGLPMGPVYYTVDRATTMEDMYARYWKEVCRLEKETEKDISTTLLIAPEFYIDNVELFESFSNTLTQPLTALGVENLLQLVFFHPDWSFRDGGARAGGGQAANYARRSPWPMINLLRTKQVRAAQKGIPTGLVYKQNEKTLGGIGAHKLETMLRLRNWDEIAEVKVDRKEYEALRVAREFQETGKVKVEDMSLANDATPAANKYSTTRVEEGDMIKVLMDALGKRLGKTGQPLGALSGPETSATAMAVDILLKELERVESQAPKVVSSGGNDAMAAARQALMEDLNPRNEHENEEASVMFGKGGIE